MRHCPCSTAACYHGAYKQPEAALISRGVGRLWRISCTAQYSPHLDSYHSTVRRNIRADKPGMQKPNGIKRSRSCKCRPISASLPWFSHANEWWGGGWACGVLGIHPLLSRDGGLLGIYLDTSANPSPSRPNPPSVRIVGLTVR